MIHVRRQRVLYAVVGWLVLCGAILWNPRLALADPPPGFEDTLVTTISLPTDIAFTPDGRLLITTQPGQLRIYEDGALLGTAALNLAATICSNSERGLLGVAVDPDFEDNAFIYLYYTYKRSTGCPTGGSPNATFPVNRVSRFILPATNIIDPASEDVLVDNIRTAFGNHNAGDMSFGTDELLYISIGDGGSGGPADDLDILAGKILRVTREGAIPAGNPYATTAGSRRCGDPAGVPPGTGPCQEIIAYGLRNPFRFTRKPGTNSFYINDVGQDEWEEIDAWPSGSGATNYGWPTREGPCGAFEDPDSCSPNPPAMTAPIFSYNHNTSGGLPTDGCGSITGSAFVPAGIWPAAYEDTYLFADYVCGKIFRLTPNGGGFDLAEFVTGLGGSSVVSMIFGPHNSTQALYYTNYFGSNGTGQVRRISYIAANNQTPLAVVAAQPEYGPAPLLVTFDASGSSDPDNDPLTFDWDFDDGVTLSGATSLTVTHTYTAVGVYTATLTAHDDQGGVSPPAAIRIDVGNTPPTPTVMFPLTSTRFYVGQPLTLQGQATDAEDGVLPASALSWEMFLHHIDQQNPGNAHTHPFLLPTSGNNIPIVAPPAEDLRAAALSYLEIKLTATDSLGRATTITQTLQPKRVKLTFVTQPAGLNLEINNIPMTSPQAFISWQAYPIQLHAPSPQTHQGDSWFFDAWSDGGAATHLITTPAVALTYTAAFTPAARLWLPVVRK